MCIRDRFNTLPHPTWLGRRDWFAQWGYRRRFAKAQDRDLLLRAYRRSRFACLPDILLGYRQERLSLKKIVATRQYVSQALLEQAWRGRDFVLLRGAAEQMVKTGVDAFAVASGLGYRLLRHRALPVDAQELLRWEAVWDACRRENAADAPLPLHRICDQQIREAA